LTKYPKEFKEKYDIIMNSSEYLYCLVEDILVHKQISLNSSLSMIYEKVDLRNSIAIIINLMKNKANFQKIDLLSEIHPSVPEIFHTEPRRLK